MNTRLVAWLLVPFCVPLAVPAAIAPACCPAGAKGEAVVNADQTVVIAWDPATKTQHFIRKASFASEGDDFGFIVPTPSQPELAESGDDAFALLKDFTKPEVQYVKGSTGMGCGCSAAKGKKDVVKASVHVLEEKLVAGFNAVVLEADDTTALVAWLEEHGYDFSPAVAAWAKPYVDEGWKFTALKVAKQEDEAEQPKVNAAALRLTFQTERPLFPYREPAMQEQAQKLKADSRLLRIYLLADKKYAGELTKEEKWTGNVAWSNQLTAEQSKQVAEKLQLPEADQDHTWWLTEFEDNWPYRPAPADLYFAADDDQSTVERPPVIVRVAGGPIDIMALAIAVVLIAPLAWRRGKKGNGAVR